MVSRKIIWGYHWAIVNLSNPGVFAPKLGARAGWALRGILRSACGVPRFESQVGLGWGFPSALGCSCGLPAFRLSSLPSDSETSFLPSLPSPSCSSAAASEIPALSQALHRILLLKQTYQPRGRSDYCLHHDRSRNEPREAGGTHLSHGYSVVEFTHTGSRMPACSHLICRCLEN